MVWMFRDLKADIRELRAGQQRMNDSLSVIANNLTALANHRHNEAGAPYFNLMDRPN